MRPGSIPLDTTVLVLGTTPFTTTASSSLVIPDITSMMWIGNYAHPATRRLATGADGAPSDGNTWYYLNPSGTDPVNGAIIAQFATPPGCTSVTVRFDALLPTGIGASTLGFGALNAGRNAFLAAESSAVLTGTKQTFSATFNGLASATEFSFVIHDNGGTSSAEARALISNVRVVPNNGTGILGSVGTTRYECDPSQGYDNGPIHLLGADSGASASNRQYFGESTQEFSFVPGGNKLVLEFCEFDNTGLGYNPITVMQNGSVLAQITPGVDQTILFSSDITVTAGVRVDVTNGIANGPQANNTDGGRLRAVHVNDTNATKRVKPPALQIVLSTDSIPCGVQTQPPSQFAWPTVARRSLSTPIALDGYVGRKLYDVAADGPTITAYVASLAPYGIGSGVGTIFHIELQTNDYGGAGGATPWANAAAYGTQLAAFADAVHAADATVMVVFQTALLRQNETLVNANGFTLPDLRTQMTTVQSTRTTWSKLLSGPVTLLTTTPVSGLHPNNGEDATIAANYVGWIRSTLGVP